MAPDRLDRGLSEVSEVGEVGDLLAAGTANAAQQAWLERLRNIEHYRGKAALAVADDSGEESDPDAVTVPLKTYPRASNIAQLARQEGATLEDSRSEPARDGRLSAGADESSAGTSDIDDSLETFPPAVFAKPPEGVVRPAEAIHRQEPMNDAVPTSSPSKQSEIIELSSASEIDDSEDDRTTRNASPVRQQASKSRQEARRRAAAAQPGRPVPAAADAPKAKGTRARKPRLSIEKAADDTLKLRGDKLTKQFATISDLVHHLEQFVPAQPAAKRSLKGCRVVLVNTDHWLAGSAAGSGKPDRKRNRLDQGARTCLTVLAKQGATLVAPEDFSAPDPDLSGPPFDLEQAEAERWTTHVVPYVLKGQRNPTYDEVLACLGPAPGGVSRGELGNFVKVVKYDWVQACAEQRVKVQETMYLLDGDFRASGPSLPALTEKQKDALRERDRRAKAKEKEDRRAADERRKFGGRGDGSADSGSDVESGSDDEHPPPVSPLNEQDWPEGEQPPVGYFDQSASLSSTESSRGDKGGGLPPPREGAEKQAGGDPRTGQADAGAGTDQPAPDRQRLEGLQEEAAFLDKYGTDAVDDLLGDSGGVLRSLLEEDQMCILSEHAGGTDEETDRESEERPCKRVKLERGSTSPHKRRSSWAADDPEAVRGQRKGPNEHIAQVLEMMADLPSSTTDTDAFRKRSYQTAAKLVRTMDKIPTVIKYSDLVSCKGIGPKIATKIIEIARTGTHRRIALETGKDKAIREFCQVYGIGRVMAERVYDMDARSVQDLATDPEKFGLSASVIKGLRYHDDLCERIPRDEITALYEHIKQLSDSLDPAVQIECMGSYRRGAADLGDIDLLVTREPSGSSTHPKTHAGHIQKLWCKMQQDGTAVDVLSRPEDWKALDAKILGLCRLPGRPEAKVRRIDILGVPWSELGAALIYFTGDDYFNRSIRLKARKHGYRLNQRGLYQNVARDGKGEKLTEGSLVPGVRTEREIFAKLCVPWREPHERVLR